MVRVCILTGNGINCENETAKAFEASDVKTEIVHINQLINNDKKLKEFDILALPGGFSYGDEIQSGKVMALKIRKYILNDLNEFIANNKLVIGICNGFQIMVHLNLFDHKEISLVENQEEKFINQWVDLSVNTQSLWTKNFPQDISLPIRHGEGRLLSMNKIMPEQIIFKYHSNINGSDDAIAGITNKKEMS
jgi:phosphoribosylformylglycinamidine (FGAM) synthase-like amidotransferase family enzyme